MNIYNITYKNIAILLSLSFLSSCGGGNTGPRDYDENQPPKRINGELAFSSPSLMKMGESFRIAGDYSNAIRLYQRAANENPTHAPSRLALGQIYERLGATDGAMTYYREVLDLEPDNTDAQLGLGQMMVKSNNPLEAIKYLKQVAVKSPDNYRIYNSIGLAYDLEGLHEEAQLSYGQGLSKKPDHIALLNNLALSFAIDGEYAPSIQLLNKALNIDYSQTTAQQNLIMVYALSGEEDAARAMASNFMTPEEIEINLAHYKWLSTLSSKRRAQAIFLNIKSFPNDEVIKTADQEADPTKTQSVVSMDPKKQMLNDILNSEGSEPLTTPPPLEKEQQQQEIEENMALKAIEDETISQDEMPINDNYYRLQLGSHISEHEALTDWDRLKKLAPDMLFDTKINIIKIITAQNSQRFRVMIGDFDNFSAAQNYCSALEERRVHCLVLKSSK